MERKSCPTGGILVAPGTTATLLPLFCIYAPSLSTATPLPLYSHSTLLPLSCHPTAALAPLHYRSTATLMPRHWHSTLTLRRFYCFSSATPPPLYCHSCATLLSLHSHSMATRQQPGTTAAQIFPNPTQLHCTELASRGNPGPRQTKSYLTQPRRPNLP